MEIENGPPACLYDYLEVQGGSISGDGAPNGRMCGRLAGSVTYYSFHESLTVLFVSDYVVRRHGFKATYTQLSFDAFTGKQCNISHSTQGFVLGMSGLLRRRSFGSSRTSSQRTSAETNGAFLCLCS